jgi:hypothetical protein
VELVNSARGLLLTPIYTYCAAREYQREALEQAERHGLADAWKRFERRFLDE